MTADVELTPEQVERAIEILDRERAALTISKIQQRGLHWFRINTTILSVSYVVLVALYLVMGWEALTGQGSITALLPVKFSTGITRIVWIGLTAIFLLSLLVAPVLLLANAGLVIKLFRQRRLIRLAGLSSVQDSLWRQHRPARQFLDYCTAGGAILGVLFLVMTLIGVGSLIWVGGGGGVWISIIMFGALGLILIAPRLITRLKQRMEVLMDVERLRRTLTQKSAEAGAPSASSWRVSKKDAEQFSAIEAAQINRERAQAITDRNDVGEQYTLLMSREVLDKRSSLDLETRLKLQQSLETLLEQPHLAAASDSPAAPGLLNVDLPETGMKLAYQVDDARRQVKAVALETEGANRSSLTSKKDGGDA